MTEAWPFVSALAAGLLLGVFFFGGLWWTVRHGLSSRNPAVLFMGSLLLRVALTLAGFRFVAGQDWKSWALCLLGFILARVIVSRICRTTGGPQPAPLPGIGHAP